MSQLREYVPDPRHLVNFDVLVVELDHTLVQYMIAILERGMRHLHSKDTLV